MGYSCSRVRYYLEESRMGRIRVLPPHTNQLIFIHKLKSGSNVLLGQGKTDLFVACLNDGDIILGRNFLPKTIRLKYNLGGKNKIYRLIFRMIDGIDYFQMEKRKILIQFDEISIKAELRVVAKVFCEPHTFKTEPSNTTLNEEWDEFVYEKSNNESFLHQRSAAFV